MRGNNVIFSVKMNYNILHFQTIFFSPMVKKIPCTTFSFFLNLKYIFHSIFQYLFTCWLTSRKILFPCCCEDICEISALGSRVLLAYVSSAMFLKWNPTVHQLMLNKNKFEINNKRISETKILQTYRI